MKIFILTSVALFAEYGDLDSLDNPSISVSVHPSLQKAQVQMKNELQVEKEEAKAGGYDNFLTKIEEKSASYQQGEIGSGCSYNLVTWEITEKEVFPKQDMKIYIARDRAVFEDEQQERFIHRHPEKENQYGRLHLFYEKPKLNHETGIWEQARDAAKIKNYMFPEIRCEECAEFTGPDSVPEHLHYPGACHK